ncbi:hypothetical protein [Nesterenkonia sp. K-15-9-6]
MRGRAQEVDLLLWGRRDLSNSSVEVRGDPAPVQQL